MRTFLTLLFLIPCAAMAEAPNSAEALSRALTSTAELATVSARARDPEVAASARRARQALLEAAEAIKSGPLCRPQPVMDPLTFRVFLEDLRRSDKSVADRHAIISRAATRHRYTVDQLLQLMTGFTKSEDRVQVAALLYDQLADPEQFQRAYDLLPFESDRRTLALSIAR
jgi:hypothetical protein